MNKRKVKMKLWVTSLIYGLFVALPAAIILRHFFGTGDEWIVMFFLPLLGLFVVVLGLIDYARR